MNQKEKKEKEEIKKKGLEGYKEKMEAREPKNVNVDELEGKFGEEVDLDKVIENN